MNDCPVCGSTEIDTSGYCWKHQTRNYVFGFPMIQTKGKLKGWGLIKELKVEEKEIEEAKKSLLNSYQENKELKEKIIEILKVHEKDLLYDLDEEILDLQTAHDIADQILKLIEKRKQEEILSEEELKRQKKITASEFFKDIGKIRKILLKNDPNRFKGE